MTLAAEGWFDGGNRGNPGHAASGAVLKIGETKIKEVKDIGIGTNNDAEYQGLILIMTLAIDFDVTHLHIRGDSMLIVKQFLGLWKCKQDHLRRYRDESQRISKKFEKISIEWVRRDFNKEADFIVTQYLNNLTGKIRS
jgi:ribonuclease HI